MTTTHPCKRLKDEPGCYEYRGRSIRQDSSRPKGYFGRFEALVTTNDGPGGSRKRLRMVGADSLTSAKAMIDRDLDAQPASA